MRACRTSGPVSVVVDGHRVRVYANVMARRNDEVNPRLVDPYEEVYGDFRTVVETAVDRYGSHSDIALVVGNAQAEALVRTIKSFTLRRMTKRQKAEYLHWLFNQMLGDILSGEKGIVARMLVREVKKIGRAHV